MNKTVKILDCTLRDGGYINDWEFGHNTLTSIYKRLDQAGLDYIEVGFLDDRRQYDYNRTIFPSTEALNKVFADVRRINAIPVAMVDFGTCSLDNIGPASESFIDGIRVIFKKEKIEEALPFCKAIKEKGYKLFIQAISITAYSDAEMLAYIQKINEIKPFAFSIVDTYGLLNNKTMARYFYLIDNNLDPEISMGYHEHNNFQLGFSNTTKFLDKDSNRVLVGDSTVYGMGKSAGNCPTELLAMYVNENYNGKYNLSDILEIIDNNILPIYAEHYWGYKLDFYIAAMQAVHPNYVKHLLDKKTLTLTSINSILESIENNKKLFYNADYIEYLYRVYQSNEIDDSNTIKALREKIGYKDVVLLGPGESLNRINNEMFDANQVVISINFAPKGIDTDIVFISNTKRYSQYIDSLGSNESSPDLLLTSNITPISGSRFQRLNYESLLNSSFICSDNSLLLILRLLINVGVKKVGLAGFDGLSGIGNNYIEKGLAFNNLNTNNYNKEMSRALSLLSKEIEINFITPTLYSL